MLHKRIFFRILVLLVLPFALFAQTNPSLPLPNTEATPLPFDKLITHEAKVNKGLINVYSLNNRYYFEIKDSILNRPVLIVNRILQSSAAIDKAKEGYSGEELGSHMITFNKGHGQRIDIQTLVQDERSIDSTKNGLKRAFDKNNIQGVLMSFDIKAYGSEGNSSIIDVTDFITGNSDLISGQYSTAKAFQADKSYVDKIYSFPINTEIQGLKTYSMGKNDSTMSLILNTSFLLLPSTPMRERYNDQRVGYFTPFNFDFDIDPQRAGMVLKIMRWRLEPKPEDIEKYKRGELVEPIKPITFYIDPTTPKVWVPYLIAGVNDWQAAFEKAGFKNAIRAIEVPKDESTWNINDARYSVIVYKPSLMANAAGPTIMDLRSGEIIGSHVTWYHNIMTLLHDWYLTQAGAIDERAHHQEFSTELMGELIRFVSSHEIGHTLGLKHNFGASSVVPVEKLRDKKWVEEHGHTPSIMDYARFNYVAQPEDSISEKGIFPRIGDYDKWAIEWGYKAYPDIKDTRDEAKMLFKLVTDSLKANPRLYYGEQGFLGISDSRCQNEDLSDNVMVANSYGIENLKRILEHLPEWTKIPTDQFGLHAGNGLRRSYSALLSQLFMYHQHVINTIGKGYYNNTTVGDTTKVFYLIPKKKQQEAMAYLNKEVFATEPVWIQPDSVLDQVWSSTSEPLTKLIADDVLGNLLNTQKLLNLQNATLLYGEKTYTIGNFLTDLDAGIWSELLTSKSVSSYHMSLQQKYVSSLSTIVENNPSNSPLTGVLRAHLLSLKSKINKVLPTINDKATIYHYNDILIQLNSIQI
ncbi:MAG: zinc-dependent metalloprotease [Bacteroidetes bacterium]|nr:zinc-dependent metalloprotease [Bacteroidota bacterium]